MHTYAKLKDGRIMVISHEDVEKECMYGRPEGTEWSPGGYNVWKHSDVDTVDSNLEYLKNKK